MLVQNTVQPFELYQQAQAQKKSAPKNPHSFLKTTLSAATIGAGSYIGYKKVTSSPELMQKTVNFFNKITGSFFKSSAKNIITQKGKVGALFAAAATILTGLVVTKNAYNKGKYAGQRECIKHHKDLGVCYSTTA